MSDLIEEIEINYFIEKTKEDMRIKCYENIARINQKCAYEGDSFSMHKDCFEASKEFLRYGGFPSCYTTGDGDGR